MFTGIIEDIAIVEEIIRENENVHFKLSTAIAKEFKIDQSIAHNGVCLTVTSVDDIFYTVTAIKETLDKSNLGSWEIGSVINIERSMPLNGRLDGHIVQGHVDCIAICTEVKDENGSFKFEFKYDNNEFITVEKGSICVNGVSLTVVDSDNKRFCVHIIPYTFEHTNFKFISLNDTVNLEFDILGKYVTKLLSNRNI